MFELRDISFSYSDERIIKNVRLSSANTAHIALIGESGCGKSTLLKLIYGLYDLDSGEIFYDDARVLGPKFHLIPGMEYMKYLAQDFDLMPFITVAENVGKFLSNIYKDQKAARVAELLELVEMSEFADIKAQYLSGGQQQRVALARVLALEPQLLLLDEPFSQIDAFRRNSLRRKLFGYLRQKQIGCVFATHDATDILAFADQVAVMKTGEIIRFDAPKSIYENPENLYTAALFGEVTEIPKHWIDPKSSPNETLFIYPAQFQIVEESGLEATVVQSYDMGSHYLVEAAMRGRPAFFNSKNVPVKGSVHFLAVLNQ